MAIRIVRNDAGNCVNFVGTTNPAYWNACLSAEVNETNASNINIINDIRTQTSEDTVYEFYNVPFTDFQDADGNDFADAQSTVDYITAKANVIGSSDGIDLNGLSVGFSLDQTSTSIIFDNGYSYGVNSIKAVADENGLISIKPIAGDRTLFKNLTHSNVLDTQNSQNVSGGLSDVVNWMNELFTVGAFESVVISDPYATMVANVDGLDTAYTLEGTGAVDPIGNDIFTNTGSGNYAGLKTADVINQAGEYYTFDIRGEGTIGFGLIHTQDSYDNGNYSGNASYANPATFAVSNSAHFGYQFSHWFHPTPNGSWTNYGANTSYSIQSGWYNWDQKQDWLDGNPVKIRCGIDTNGFISIESLNNDGTWKVHSRSGYPVPQGSEFHLGIKVSSNSARVYSIPKVHLLEDPAPTMYFRYIESPDGNFEYPLFATEEEANYYDEQQDGGTGTSHTHTYADDPTNTTWYMPDNNRIMNGTTPPQDAQHTTFLGNPVTYTEVTSLTNSDLTPSAYVGSDIVQEEGTNVNIQVSPQDVSYSTSVDISPAGSGLVYNGTFLIQGTLADVGADTVYTVTVTRANSYGSSVGTFTITATDVAPVATNDTPWTKALDFSGSNEYAKQVSSSQYVNAIRMGGYGANVANNSDSTKTADSGYSLAWATSAVFKTDRNSSNQHIWNMGAGAGNNDKNIYLRTDSAGNLYFGWGKGSNNNECIIAQQMASNNWYGVYIAHKGGRFSYGDLNVSNLSDAFDIRLTSDSTNWTLGSNLSTTSNWTTGGNNARTDLSMAYDLTIGGRGSNRNFHGKVASMVITTLKRNTTIPTDAEISLMITDPVKWVADYKVGNDYRYPNTTSNYPNFQIGDTQPSQATQVWLMGDGASDSYANGMRNYVQTSDQNWTKLQLNSMVSNDIQTVNINGLT